MKSQIMTIILICIVGNINKIQAQADGNNSELPLSIRTDGALPDSSAMLDVQSTTKGILVPRMTTAQRNAIATPANSLMVFDTNTGSFWFYKGTFWQEVGADNLGNHTATQNLKLAGNYLSSDGDSEGIFVDGNGNVGIGTSALTRPLEIKGTGINSNWLGLKNNAGTDTWLLSNKDGGFNFTEINVEDHRLYLQQGGNVGIGTGTPANRLSVAGSANFTGNVGIGTASPTQKLSVVGNADFTGNVSITGNLGIGTSALGRRLEIQGIGLDSDWLGFRNNTGAATWHLSNKNGGFNFAETGVTDYRLYLQQGGNVGIGTGSPANKLSVAGSADFTGNVIATAFTGDGSGLTNLPNWSLTGNAGTVGGTNFIGTTDDVALEFKVNNMRAMRIEPNGNAPNLIGGFSGNTVSGGAYGATISGGGSSGNINAISGTFATIAGGYANSANGGGAVISGGNANSADGGGAVVSGGNANSASGSHTTVGGGIGNSSTGIGAVVSGGFDNSASGSYTTMGGGRENQATSQEATVAGGGYNTASGTNATIGGGRLNQATSQEATVAGGGNNIASGIRSTVGGGSNNTASGTNATIGGGGGFSNGPIGNQAGGYSSTVPGGSQNQADGDYSLAAGRRAKIAAAHDGTFLFSDSTDLDFNSAAANEFAARATGGVRFVTAIDGSGNPTQTASIDNTGTVTATAFVGDGSGLTNLPGDNLGNHTATQNILLNGHYLSGDGGSEGVFVDGSGNVGIGTNTPKGLLHVNGDYYGKGHVFLHAFGGDGNSGTAYLQARDDSGSSSINLQLRTQNGGSITDAVLIDSTGNVGIGTTTPTKAKVEIQGTQATTLSYGFLNSAGNTGTGSGTNDYSLYASDRIAASEFNAFSDARIKKILGPSDCQQDLSTLMDIEITDYTLLDTIAKGTQSYKKVIAQQVEEVFPQAVSTSTDVVPDIYQRAEVVDGWVQLATDLQPGERVKIIMGQSAEVYEVTQVEESRFQVAALETQNSKLETAFVYGREVDDFHTVDYEAIAMLNVSATQEQQRKMEELEKVLLDRINKLEAMLLQLQSQVSSGNESVSAKK